MSAPDLRKNFVFSARGNIAEADARATINACPDITILRNHGNTFLGNTTQVVADELKAAHKDWVVAIEQFYPRPGPVRYRIRKGPN